MVVIWIRIGSIRIAWIPVVIRIAPTLSRIWLIIILGIIAVWIILIWLVAWIDPAWLVCPGWLLGLTCWLLHCSWCLFCGGCSRASRGSLWHRCCRGLRTLTLF